MLPKFSGSRTSSTLAAFLIRPIFKAIEAKFVDKWHLWSKLFPSFFEPAFVCTRHTSSSWKGRMDQNLRPLPCSQQVRGQQQQQRKERTKKKRVAASCIICFCSSIHVHRMPLTSLAPSPPSANGEKKEKSIKTKKESQIRARCRCHHMIVDRKIRFAMFGHLQSHISWKRISRSCRNPSYVSSYLQFPILENGRDELATQFS